jgi:hypothetical protein
VQEQETALFVWCEEWKLRDIICYLRENIV